jgi:ABC-2 type transport system permease protein
VTTRIVAAIVRKDLVAFSRDRFFAWMTIAGLVAYIAVFWLLPSEVDETVRLGVYAPGIDSLAEEAGREGVGLSLRHYPSREALAGAVEDGEGGIVAGIVFPEGFLDDVTAGRSTQVELLVTAELPAEYRYLMSGLVYGVAGIESPGGTGLELISTPVVLGVDRAGDQISLQEQMRPLLAFFVLMVETLALATLVAAEVHARTVTALLVSPATIADFLTAKGLLGTGLAFAEAALLMAAMAGFGPNPAIVAVTLLLGALLVTGFGMVAGTLGKDFLGVLFWSMAFMVPLTIPAFGVLFRGNPALWIKALPTYGLVETIVAVTVDGEGWGHVAPALGGLAAWGVACFVLGTLVLRRRVATL